MAGAPHRSLAAFNDRLDKKSTRSPDFRHKSTHKTVWMEDWLNPSRLKAGPAAKIQGREQYGDGPDYCQRKEFGDTRSVEEVHYSPQFVWLGAPGGLVNKNSNGPCGDVRMLCKAGRLKDALYILNKQGILADYYTYACVLQECINMKGLTEGRQVHTHINQSRFKPNVFVFNNLVNMYVKCGSVVDARQVFDKMPERDMYTWNIMIAGYAKHGFGSEALKIYERMQQEGVTPNIVTFICVLNACARLTDLEKGKEVHDDIIKAGIVLHIKLENTLVNMYAKCRSIKDARRVFDKMVERDVISWSAMIAGYARHGCGREALEMYKQMVWEGVTPNEVTFICALNACATMAALEEGKEFHADIMKAEILLCTNLATALVDMYAKCGSMRNARQVFDSIGQQDLVSWNTIIAGYAQHGFGREALEMFEKMLQEGVTPDKITFTCVLNACASLGALGKGKEVHADIMRAGIVSYINLENSLVDMYAKCGSMKDAHVVFDKMSQRDVVSWSTMITGYAQHGCGREAFDMYGQMIREGVTPDKVTFICILNACSSLAALEKGKEVHADIIKAGVASYIHLENILVDMYAKCGSMKDACQVFDNMAKRDLVSWNTIIGGYAQHGCAKEALQLFEQMQKAGLKPDGVTFICLLFACSHVGLLDEGRHYFDSMSQDHGLTPTIEHFGCMVDLLGRAGHFDKAEDLINKMPIEPGVPVWAALLGACRIHGNVELAERVAKFLS